MAKHYKRMEVEGVFYQTNHYMPTQGLNLMTKLGRYFGKPMAILMSKDEKAKVDATMIFEIISSAFDTLPEEEVIPIITKIISTTEISDNGRYREINFDMDFVGKYLHLFKLLGEILQFQYNDFFGGLATVGAKQMEAESEMVSEPTSRIQASKKK